MVLLLLLFKSLCQYSISKIYLILLWSAIFNFQTKSVQLDCYIIKLLYDHDNRYYFSFSFSLQKLSQHYVFMVIK